MKDPPKLANALSELVALRGLARAKSGSQLEELWQQAADEAWVARTRPVGIKRGVLQIAVDSAPLKSELESFHKANVLSEFTSVAPHLRVRDIKFVLQRT